MKTIENYRSELHTFGLKHKLLLRLVDIVRNNPDRYCFLSKDITPSTPVSPYFINGSKSKPLINALKCLQIYNIICDRYDGQQKCWYFSAFSNKGKVFQTSVKKDEFGQPIIFEEAVGIALIRIHDAIIAYRQSEVDHVSYLESEVDYDILESAPGITSKLNKLNALMDHA